MDGGYGCQCLHLTPADGLLNGDEKMGQGDAGCEEIAKHPKMASTRKELKVAMRPVKLRSMPDTPDGRLQNLVETAKADIKAKVEHLLQEINQEFGFQKTRLGVLD